MEKIEQVEDFFDAVAQDPRMGVYHISLYLALVHLRGKRSWENPIRIFSREVLAVSRMGIRKYQRCMKELVSFGYIRYTPSTDSAVGSEVYFRKL